MKGEDFRQMVGRKVEMGEPYPVGPGGPGGVKEWRLLGHAIGTVDYILGWELYVKPLRNYGPRLTFGLSHHAVNVPGHSIDWILCFPSAKPRKRRWAVGESQGGD